MRRGEANYLAPDAEPSKLALLAGDFNSVSPHDGNPKGFADLPARDWSRYVGDDLRNADNSVLSRLEMAGWHDIGHKLGANATPTIPAKDFTDMEFAVMRCDFVLTTEPLAACAKNYRVTHSSEADMASDHYPVVTTFDLAA